MDGPGAAGDADAPLTGLGVAMALYTTLMWKRRVPDA